MGGTKRDERALADNGRLHPGALILCIAILVLIGAVAASVALADPSADGGTPGFADSPAEASEAVPIGSQPEKPNASAPVPTSQEVAEAIEAGPMAEPVTTDPAAAEGVPRGDLGRGEALELLEGVFEPELGAPAGIFDKLEVEKFLAPNVAVVTQGKKVESTEQSTDGTPETQGEETALLDSTIPLRAEAPSGNEEAIDLDLERAEGELRSANPLVDVGMPEELAEGIDLPAAEIHIDLVDAPPERSPTIINGNVAGFPNVAGDTDFAIAPTPTGFETLTQLRTDKAPHSETYRLSLPEGATLAKEGEGAVVTREGKPLLGVAPPTAIDATGAAVPTSLSVSGDSLTVTVSPDETTQLPILVDPVFQTYEWMAKNTEEGFNYYLTEGWGPYEHSEGDVFDWGSNIRTSSLSPPMTYGLRGLYTASISSAAPGSEFFYMYHVPRYYSDPPQHEGQEPETFITKMTVSDMGWQAESEKLNPYVYMGLWGPSAGWASLYTHEGLIGHSLNNFSWIYPFTNELNVPDVKVAEIGIRSTESVNKAWDYLYVGAATIEMSEPAGTIPKFAEVSGPPGWLNQAPAPVNFKVEDAGLGVSSVTVSGVQGSSPPNWKATYNCTGVAGHACPYTWKSSKSIEPAALPQGIDNLKLVAQDPIGHVSTVEKEGKVLDSHVQVKVDHTAPSLALTGSITEQEQLGTRRASYTLKATGSDGNAEAPQSGIAKAEVKLDGKVVTMEGKQAEEWSPKCATENCPLAAEWTLNTAGLAEGKHTVEVIATDAVGNSTTKTLTIETHAATPPTLGLSGSMTEQATLGTSRPRYSLKAKSIATAAGAEAPPLGAAPAYASSIGSQGTGNGQFNDPVDVGVDSSGNTWVLNWGLTASSRLQEFNEKGEWIHTAGAQGSGAGQLNGPTAMAVDSQNNIWVSDTGNNRIVEFNAKGEFVQTFGTNVNKTKVEAGGTEAEKNLCTAASGNVCQAATAGSLAGQLKTPKGIALTSGGNIWVVDAGNNRLQKFSPSGTVLNTISGEGTEAGKLKAPTAITVAPDGSIWVADTGNNRIEQWNSSLTFVRAIGKEGSGGGEFKSPAAIEADASGTIWVGDKGNNRVEVLGEGGRYFGQFGAFGSGRFSLTSPMGIAVAPDDSVWVTDPGHYTVQKWTQEVPRSEITTLLWIDGTQQTGLKGACSTASCTIEPQWTLQSLALAAGSHSARVKTTDGLGRSTESTLSFQIARDTTKPALEVSGELFNAPEGWVEQESYGLNATATDAGFGVTSIVLKIDGQQVASVSQSCLDGGCTETLGKQISMASYAGGSHSAELVATDGAGNTFVKHWTINVDPEGHISAAEAEDTLEAADETSESSVVAPTSEVLEQEQREGGDNPGLQQSGSEISSTGVPDTTTMTTNPAEGFTIHSPEGQTTITPIVGEGSSSTSIAEGVAGVSADTGHEADLVVRPEFNGVQTFQAIRSVESPEAYSWQVHLAEDQSLRLANSTQAEVVYKDGTLAFLITAEAAHDATGTPVPTSLEVDGSVLTLWVHFHSGTFVYPIVAGQGWETSYRVPVTVEGPEDEAQIREREERERALREAAEAGEEAAPPPPSGNAFSPSEAQTISEAGAVEEIIPAPAPSGGGGGASASSVEVKTVKPLKVCGQDHCSIWHIELKNPSYFYKLNSNNRLTAWWEPETQVHSSWYYNGIYLPELTVEGNGDGFVGPGQVWEGEHKHLTIWGRYTVNTTVFTGDGGAYTEHTRYALQIWVWPNGDQQRKIKNWDPNIEIVEQ